MKIHHNMLDFHGAILCQDRKYHTTLTPHTKQPNQQRRECVLSGPREWGAKPPCCGHYWVMIEPGNKRFPLSDNVEAILIDKLGQGQ